MTILYIVRHGNIDYNLRIPGRQKGLSLSVDGRNQALSLIKRFSTVRISAIYSSPLERAVETAMPLSDNKGISIQIMDGLNEIDFGSWSANSFSDLEDNILWKQFHMYRNGVQIPGGETMINVQQRMITAVDEICGLWPDQSVCIFSHNDPIKSIIAYYCGISLDQFLRVSIGTGSVSAVSCKNNIIRVLFIATTGKIPLIAT